MERTQNIIISVDGYTRLARLTNDYLLNLISLSSVITLATYICGEDTDTLNKFINALNQEN